MNIPLGYEVETGRRVSIPLNHSAVIGQTQLSGKTTTLEAMVERSGVRAVAFITKPGEKSFRTARSIPAFFSEATLDEYWKYVLSIVEYHSGYRLGFRERGTLMKLCQDYTKGISINAVDKKTGETKKKRGELRWQEPDSLDDLLGNIETWLPHSRGMDEMICMQLREYLRPAIREIKTAEFSDKLRLERGINVMNVTDLSDGLKTLVIRSVIEWIHKKCRKTVVIIPEAWKFIPEGRTTPVKLALEGLIREGAGVENFVWMDSQDLRGVDKMLLRSVIVWLFGVQRQKNEVASTLASIPDHPKPSATEIMQLGKGQFYVCYGNTLKLTYVQPAGMEDAHAQAIARGEESPDSWRQIVRALDEENQSEGEEEALAGGDAGTSEDGVSLAEGIAENSPEEDRLGGNVLLSKERERSPAMEHGAEGEMVSNTVGGQAERSGGSPGREIWVDESEGEALWKEKYENLAEEHLKLIETHDAMAQEIAHLREEIKTLKAALNNEFDIPSTENESDRLDAGLARTAPRAGRSGSETGADKLSPSAPAVFTDETREIVNGRFVDWLWNDFKIRAQKDPRVLEILAARPELRVTIERERIYADGKTLRGALAILISEKFFDTAREFADIRKDLIRRGFLGSKAPNQQISQALKSLVELQFLTAEDGNCYQAVPGMKVNIIENKIEKAAAAR
jgi:hypothetical protein